jgi:glycosyltransferase involved in cell wall biosynthesis
MKLMVTDFSIVFATFNGSDTLEQMLESLLKVSEHSAITFEVLAVNNNSTDNTGLILEKYHSLIPLKILNCEKQGKNHCLNMALPYINSERIIFTDDDVIFSPDILNQYKLSFDTNLKYDIFGGHVLPFFVEEPPHALLNAIPSLVAFALTNSDVYKEGEIAPESLLGPNMAVRKTVLSSLQFNTNIGPSGNNYVMGSETDFLFRAKEAGFKAYFVESSKVKHIIQPCQFKKGWLSNRAFKAGRALVHEQSRNGELDNAKKLFGYPRWSLKRQFISCIHYFFSSKHSYRQFYYLWDCYFMKGYKYECRKSVTESQ